MEVLVILTAIIVLATAVLGLLAKIRAGVKETQAGVQEVHVLVNSRLDEALARIGQLDEALRAAGVGSPPRPERTD